MEFVCLEFTLWQYLFDQVRKSAPDPLRSVPVCTHSVRVALVSRARDMEHFQSFLFAREQLKQNMEKGAAVHEKLPREFAELFQAKQAHNVSRADDPPTVGLAAFARASIQGVPNPRRKSLLILNFALWRTLAGTVPFALLLGFCYGWGCLERVRVQEAFMFVWRKGLADIFISAAYTAPRGILYGLRNADLQRARTGISVNRNQCELEPRWPK